MSRRINKLAQPQHIALDDLRATEAMREEGNYMCIFDLENQFFHVKLAEEAKEYFGFAITREDGQEEYYHFNGLIYSFTTAVAVVTRLIQPIQAYLHVRGVQSAIYVDGRQVQGRKKEETEAAMRLTLQVFQLVGWNVQWRKTELTAM